MQPLKTCQTILCIIMWSMLQIRRDTCRDSPPTRSVQQAYSRNRRSTPFHASPSVLEQRASHASSLVWGCHAVDLKPL